MKEEKNNSFEDVVKPVIKWLCENANPHSTVIVDCTHAELLSGEAAIETKEYIKD